jgi:RHS repeat-associated protein
VVAKNGAKTWEGVYRAFGEIKSETGSWEQRLRFPGQYYDQENNNYYNYFRDYDPAIGRYIQSDPLGLHGGLNLYPYVYSNPLNFYDPYGLFGVADMPMFPDPVVAAALGAQDGLKCVWECLTDIVGISAVSGAGLGASPSMPISKGILPRFIIGKATVKKGPTSLGRVVSVIFGKVFGQKNGISSWLTNIAKNVKVNPIGSAKAGASRGGAIGALGAISYCGVQCAANSCE